MKINKNYKSLFTNNLKVIRENKRGKVIGLSIILASMLALTGCQSIEYREYILKNTALDQVFYGEINGDGMLLKEISSNPYERSNNAKHYYDIVSGIIYHDLNSSEKFSLCPYNYEAVNIENKKAISSYLTSYELEAQELSMEEIIAIVQRLTSQKVK